MKLVYLILAHNQPQQLQRLVAALDQSEVGFAIHIDAKVDVAPFIEAIGSLPNVHWVQDRISVNWAGFSQIEATLALLHLARERFPEYKRASLLSGACYPVASNDRLLRLCDKSTNYISLTPVPEAADSYQRISRYHLPDHPFLNPRTPRDQRALSMGVGSYVQEFLRHLPPPTALPLDYYKGSQWWSLSRAATDYCLNYIEQEPYIVERFRYSWVPDESFFHTLLGNSPFKKICRPRLHYIDWTRESIKKGKVLDESCFEKVVGSRFMFVRKVAPDTSAILLDQLDALRADQSVDRGSFSD